MDISFVPRQVGFGYLSVAFLHAATMKISGEYGSRGSRNQHHRDRAGARGCSEILVVLRGTGQAHGGIPAQWLALRQYLHLESVPEIAARDVLL